MVAIVGGNRLGLNLGSLSALGQRRGVIGSATQGRSGERAYVNVATGDLVLQDLDASLSGLGSDTQTMRTYNSQAGWGYEPDQETGWQIAPRKYVEREDERLRRYDVDGSACDYVWDPTRRLFVATLSAGSALDTIRVNADGSYTWTDGASGVQETYAGGEERALLTARTDTSGNTVRYEYDEDGLLTRVINADGERVEYTWGGSRGEEDGDGEKLLQVSTFLASGQALRQVSYAYDGEDRLASVTVNLDPEGKVPAGSEGLSQYVTTYAYDGESDRVATVSQSDGTTLSFTYVHADEDGWRVATVTDGDGQVTNFAYDTEDHTTTVTDPYAVSTVYRYDDAGQLTEIRSGVTAGNPRGLAQLQYAYNEIGDVTSITDGLGQTVAMQYDANGNLTSQIDSAGNTLRRTYDARNQLLTETLYATAATVASAATDAETTRYVHDAGGRNLLRFQISPEGRVTEYRYDAHGQRVSTIQYPAAGFDVSATGATGVPSEAQMLEWVARQDLSKTERQDMAYDFRGQLQKLSTYAQVDATGAGIAATASATQYVYDPRGLLLQTITPDGRGVTQLIYDGLGRVVSSVQKAADGSISISTITQYDDANGKTTVTLANGLATTSAYDRAGRLISVMQSSPSTANLGTTHYLYDADGRLLMTQDPTGQRNWFLYDEAGRKVADVDAAGTLTEYVYDANGHVTELIAYDTAVDTSRLVDAAGNPTTALKPGPGQAGVTLASLRPSSSDRDRRSWNLYDAAGRLTDQVDALGYVTRTTYDGESRILSVTKLSTPIATGKLGNGIGVALQAAGASTTTQLAPIGGGNGAPVLLTATVTSSGSPPAGSVTFFAGQTCLGAAQVKDGIATLSVANLSAGLSAITAVYSGDGQHRTSASGTASSGSTNPVGELSSTATALSVDPSVSDASALRLTADVSGLDPRGNVIFYSGGVPVGSAAVENGRATLELTNLPVGTNQLTATYLGDQANSVSASAIVNAIVTVTRGGPVLASTNLALVSGGTVARNGALAVRVSGTNPTGLVTFFNGTTVLGTATVVNGVATLTGVLLPVGEQTFTVTYSGDSQNATSVLGFHETVTAAPTTTTLIVSDSDEDRENGPLQLLARVTGADPGGTVTFYDGATLLGTASLANGAAAITAFVRPSELRALKAVYSGDGNNAISASAPLPRSAEQEEECDVGLTSTPSLPGGPLTLTATVSDEEASGLVTFVCGSTVLGTGVLTAGGREPEAAVATLVVPLSALPPGGEPIVAIYAGDARHGAAISADVMRPAMPTTVIALGTTAADRAVERIYNRDGLLRASIDAEGYLVETRYDTAGQPIETIAYANRVPGFTDAASIEQRLAAARTSDSLAALVPANDARDVHTFSFFDGRGQKIAAVDGEGFLTELAYDVNGRLSQTVRYANKANQPVTALSSLASLRPLADRADQVSRNTYDALGRLDTSTNAEGTVSRNEYDNVGRLVATTVALNTDDARTGRTQYDVQGRVTAELSPAGAALLASAQTPAEIDAIWANYATSYTYDAAGRRTSSTDPNHNRTVFFYDDAGRVRFTVNAMGEVAETSYDALGHVTATTRSATALDGATVAGLGGGLLSASANAGAAAALAAALRAAPEKNSVNLFSFDARGELTRSVDAEGGVVTSRFDAFGELLTSTQAIDDGRRVSTVSEYDRRGLQLGSVSDAGDASHVNARTSIGLDAFGRMVRATDANGHTTVQTFDRLGRVVQMVDPTNALRSNTYDAFGRVLTQQDANGHTTTYSYDDARRRLVVTTPEGITLETIHNREGQTQTVIDGRGNATTSTYDRNGNLLSTETPLGDGTSVRTSTVYDRANRVIETRDGNQSRVVYTYDAANRLLTRVVDPDGLALKTSYGYDAKGQQILTRDANGVVTAVAYDRKGQILTQAVDPDGLNLVTKYTYDERGKQLTIESPGHTLTKFVYDDLGRRLQTIVDPGGLAVTESFAYDKTGNVLSRTDANGKTGFYVYDADDRQRYAIDAEGGVTETIYDAKGNATEHVTYARRLDLSTWKPGDAVVVPADPARDLRVRTVYDQMDRAIFTIDGVGAVTRMRYDASGNLVERIAYAQRVDPATPRTADAISLALLPDSSIDARIRREYDALNRLSLSADATGAVTRQVYDANGNLVKMVAYAARIGRDAPLSSVRESLGDRVNLKAYDRGNRLVYQVDALGGVIEQVFDNDGNVVQRIAHANRIETPTASTVPLTPDAIQVVADPVNDRSNRAVYDAVNRLVYAVDAAGAVTRTVYDANGNVVATTAYATPIDSSALPQIARPGDVQVPASAADRTTLHVYDSANHLAYTVDAGGYVRHDTYDGAGRVLSSTLYDRKISGLVPGASVADVQRALSIDPARDETDSFVYDAAGHLISSTDALGGTESYSYNGAGDRLTMTNKLGATWNYDYDAAGRRILETDPAVSLTTVTRDGAGNLIQGGEAAVRLVTRTEYDGLGNLVARTEAVGRPEERTTRYVYDALGRQVKTIFPPAPIYTPESAAALAANGANQPAARLDLVRETSTETFYDAFGDAVANLDAAGNASYKAYDKLGRVVYEVDALGYVTGYDRNTFGDATAVTRYAEAVELGASTGNAPSVGRIAAGLVHASHASDRTIQTEYDRLGRGVTVTQPQGWVFDGDGRSYLAAAVVKNAFDAFGQKVQTAIKAGQDPELWATTTHYFDARGQEVASVDPMGFVTTQEFDAAGNVTRLTEFAKALTSWSPASTPNPEASADDRTVVSAYDRDNRKTSDTRVGIEFSTASDGTSRRGDVVASFGYDAVGNLTRGTQDLGDGNVYVTYTYYDALGRTLAVAAPARASTADGAALTPLTLFGRDAYGNVLFKAELANGAASATAQGFVPGASSAQDRVTLSAYDARGKLLETRDAEGFSKFLAYDAMGRMAKQWQTVTSDDGVAGAAHQHTLFTLFQYDALGRQTGILMPASSSVLSGSGLQRGIGVIGQQDAGTVTTEARYNGFGELVSRATYATGTAPEASSVEVYEYDNAGRMWRTNAGDGNVKVSLYDLMGRQTARISSAGSQGSDTDLGVDLSQAADAQQVDAMTSGVRRSDSKLDLLGRGVRQTLPLRQDPGDDAAYRPVIEQSFDRWGNVLTQTDPRNHDWVTSFRYNANNQVVEERQPIVSVLGSDGALQTTTPTTHIFYDALGRQVALRDANGNVSGQVFDALGQVVRELHADGGVVTNAYDAFGDRVQLTDALGHVTAYDYDRLGRNTVITTEKVDVTSVDDDFSVRTRGDQRLVTVRSYDELGHVVAETKQGISYAANGVAQDETTRFTYDLRGNLVATQQPLGQISRSVFDVNSKQIASQDGNGNVSTWAYDAFGLLVAHQDFQIQVNNDVLHVQPTIGVVEYGFRYDNARQLLAQWNDRGDLLGDGRQSKNLTYKYDGAGQMVEIRDQSDAGRVQVTTYRYNAAGKHVWERTSQGGASDIPGSPVYQDQVLAYDELGRLARVSGLDGVDVRFDYDAVGNRMHQAITYVVRGQGHDVSVPTDVIVGYDPDTNAPIYGTQTSTQYDPTYQTQELWYAYDAMNRQTLVDGAFNGNAGDLGNVTSGQGHLLTYDKNGNRKTDTFWGQQVGVNQPPQTAGWDVFVGDGEGGGSWTRVAADDANKPAFDGTSDGQIVDVPMPDGGSVEYRWTVDPVLPREIKAQAGIVTESYDYDGLDRLTRVYTAQRDASFQVVGGQTVTLQNRHYDGASRAVVAGPEGALSQDYVDALTQKKTDAYTANTSVTVYDANGRMLRQRVTKEGGKFDHLVDYQTTGWDWTVSEPLRATNPDGSPKVDANGNPVFVPQTDGTGQPILDDTGNPSYVQPTTGGTPRRDADGKIVYVQKTDGTGQPVYDAQGVPVMVTLSDGSQVQKTDGTGLPVFDAYGKPVYVPATLNDGTPRTDAAGNPIYLVATDGTGKPLFDAHGKPLYVMHDVRHSTAGGYDGAGNVKAYKMVQGEGKDESTSFYNYGQVEYDGYKEGTVAGYRKDNQDHPGVTSEHYDANGFLTGIDDSTKGANNRNFWNDASGHVLLKNQENHLLRQLVVDGNVLAVYGAGTDPKKPATDKGDPNYAVQGDFDLNFQPISNAYPAPTGGQYTVQGGDTLQTIALSAYGDSSQWYVIANANGLRGDQDLRIGQTLIIPNRVGGAHNSADTFKPYDPSKVVGDTSPNLPVPSSGGGCGALGIILTIVIIAVAVLVTVYTAGAATALLAPGMAGTLGSLSGTMALGGAALAGGTAATAAAGISTGALIAGAVIGGAVGSVASQGLSMAFGMQKEFSWTQVAMGGIGAGVGAGLGAAVSAMPSVNTAIQSLQGPASWAVAGARSAIANAATQGIAVMTHLQKEFSWQSVAATAVGGGVGAMASEATSGVMNSLFGEAAKGDFGRALVTGAVSGFAGGMATAAMRGGRIDILQVATDAFGNALAGSLRDKLMEGGDQIVKAQALSARVQQAPAAPSENDVVQPTLQKKDNEAPAAKDDEAGTSKNGEHSPENAEPATYRARKGQGPLAIASNLDPDNEYAVMALLVASKQLKYDPASNRWVTHEGQEYTADLSKLSDDMLDKLDAIGRKLVSAEGRVDAQRAAVAAERAQMQHDQEAARQQQAQQQAAGAQAQLDQRAAATAAPTREPGLAERALSWLGAQEKSNEAFYTAGVNNADSAGGAILNSMGRALSGAGFDVAKSFVGLAALGGKAYDAAGYAVDHPMETLVAAVDAGIRVNAALGDAIAHPVDTANAIADVTTTMAKSSYKAASDYVNNTPIEQMGEDALRVVAGGLAQAGAGKVLGAVGSLAGEGITAVSTKAGAAMEALLPETELAGTASGLRTAAATTAEKTEQYGVRFFGADQLKYYSSENATLGRAGSSVFMMPAEDAAMVTDAASAARYSGMAPSVTDAYKAGGDVFGISFPTEGMEVRLPTAADAGGWPHFLEGGHTAVKLEGPNAGYLLNPTREFVVPGGGQMPQGSVLFKLGENGSWAPLRKW